MAAAFASWPFVVQLFSKTLFAWLFTYHTLNGVRHLVWGNAKMMVRFSYWDGRYVLNADIFTQTNQRVNATGWAVVGLSVVSALGLALFW